AECIQIDCKDDVVVTQDLRVKCEGPEDGRHPAVYLTMLDDMNGKPQQVVCPYCSRVFKYQGQGNSC
ncbi:MAG: zinc-finger domain-containing protein, partial [Alphaproteobacteria bacterium]|nr:zinc-finger domain-containing protein [Alphaproteobacteria bacterium]